MRTIAHRELRNNSSRVLDDVKNGEIIEVTNHGEVVAILVPPGSSRYELMKLAGAIRPRRSDASFESLRRVTCTETIADMLDDLRGDR